MGFFSSKTDNSDLHAKDGDRPVMPRLEDEPGGDDGIRAIAVTFIGREDQDARRFSVDNGDEWWIDDDTGVLYINQANGKQVAINERCWLAIEEL